MRVDFYHLTRDPAEKAVALIAQRAVTSGGRLLVVAADPRLRERVSETLWSVTSESFLANGQAGEGGEERQLILLSAEMHALNGARFVTIADGQWREAAMPFERTFFLFDEDTRQSARGVWRDLKREGGRELHYWKQEGGRWVEAG